MSPRALLAAGALALMALAACQDERAPDLPPVGAARVELERAACEAKGGRFGPGGKAGGLVCFTTPADAGRQCRRASDCESACLARSRTCAPVAPLFGCNEIITDSGLRVTQCID